jgi:hypothetical protein
MATALRDAILVVACLLCASAYGYDGDGQLKDLGPFNPNVQYILDLGAVDLAKSRSYNFRVNNLPMKEFVFGLQLLSIPSSSGKSTPLPQDSNLELTIIDSTGRTLVSENAKLVDWIRSEHWIGNAGFLYRGGVSAKGSNLTPSYRQNLTVTLRVSAIRPDESYPAKLVGVSSGWK